MNRKEILAAAEHCVCGQREQDYGTPENSFKVIGELWEVYIKEKCVGTDTTGLKSLNPEAPRSCVPWLASQTDMLAEDWELYW